MEYIKPYTYFVQKENGPANLVWGSLALFSTSVIPIVGQVVVLGYQAQVAEDLKNDPALADHRDFDANKFVDYLTRGVWPFLVQFGLGMIAATLALVVFAIGMAIGWAVDEPVVGLVAFGVALVPILLAVTLLTWPLVLHAQLSDGIKIGPAYSFTIQFFRKVGGQLFFSMLAHSAISMPIALVGMLLCCVGLYPALMITVMAQEHYMIQLYRIYLDEGGEPIGGPVGRHDGDDW